MLGNEWREEREEKKEERRFKRKMKKKGGSTRVCLYKTYAAVFC